MVRILIAVIFICLSNVFLLAQANPNLYPYSRFQWGFYLNGGGTLQEADFQKLPNTPNCCPQFSKGYGYNSEVGFLVENPFSNLFLYGFKLGFFYSNNLLSSDELFLYNVNGNLFDGKIRHTINTVFSSASVKGGLGLRFLDNVILNIGLRSDFNFVEKFSQKEELVEPSFGVFENNSRIRNEVNNQDIPNANFISLYGFLGLSLEYPLNKKRTTRLCPELTFNLPLNPVVKDYKWKQNLVSLGLAFKFSKEEEYPLFIDLNTNSSFTILNYKSCGNKEYYEFEPDTLIFQPIVKASAGIKRWELLITNKDKVLNSLRGDSIIQNEYRIILSQNLEQYKNLTGELEIVFALWDWDDKETEVKKVIKINKKTFNFGTNISLSLFDNKKNLINDDTIRIEKTITTNLKPLLNYVFFEDGSQDISDKYIKLKKEDTKYFKVNYLSNQTTLETYYHFLNIVGYRMVQNPYTNIDIIGCVSGKGLEKNNFDLARKRAEAVYEYLSNVWGIDTNRLTVSFNTKTMGLPEIPSKPESEEHSQEADEENRRVEIICSPENNIVLAPVHTKDTLLNSNVDFLQFVPKVESSFDIDYWELSIYRNNKLFYEFKGRDSLPKKIELPISKRLIELHREMGDLEFSFYAINKKKQDCKTSGRIPVKITTNDSTLDRFILILFDFNSYELTKNNLEIVKLIQDAIEDSSEVTIVGYTDRIGDYNVNMKLSKNRALSAASGIFNQEIKEDKNTPVTNFNTNIVVDRRSIQYLDAKGNIKNVVLTVKGMGEEEPLLYDNSIPEGRFYCRTVVVELKKALK